MFEGFFRATVDWVPFRTFEPERVAGVTFKNDDATYRQHVLRRCRNGDRVLLERQTDNPRDPNAVAVIVVRRGQIGFLSAEAAQWVAPLMDSGEAQLVGSLSSVSRFETDDGRRLFAAEVTITELRRGPVDRFSWKAAVQVYLADFRRLMRGFQAHVVPRIRTGLRRFDSRLLSFAQGNRLFCNLYWSLIAIAMLLIGGVLISGLLKLLRAMF